MPIKTKSNLSFMFKIGLLFGILLISKVYKSESSNNQDIQKNTQAISSEEHKFSGKAYAHSTIIE